MKNTYVDEAYLIRMRRALHQIPEIGYDLPKTVALLRGELDEIGIPYTEKYAPCSLVADIGPADADFTLALRADIDALPVEEKTGLPFSSAIPGQMHACGHDTHAAILLAAAKVLWEKRNELGCRVRLIFQPNEEGADSTPPGMIKKGVLDGVDAMLALHNNTALDVGTCGIHAGPFMASCRNFTVTIRGKENHAARPEGGNDALAAAVSLYQTVQAIRTCRVSPKDPAVIGFGALNAGHAHNVVPGEAVMLGTVRTYDEKTDRFLFENVRRAADSCAQTMGCTAEVTSSEFLPPVINDKALADALARSAEKIVGDGNVLDIEPLMSSEDLADFAKEVPTVFFHIGVGTPGSPFPRPDRHSPDYVLDERGLAFGADIFVGFALDHPHGYR